MSEELERGIPKAIVTGKVIFSDEEKKQNEEDFEKILKQIGVLENNQSIKDFTVNEKSYEEEKRALFDWLCEKVNEYHDKVEEMHANGIFSLDSEAGLECEKARMEYNEKLIALKKKYNVK